MIVFSLKLATMAVMKIQYELVEQERPVEGLEGLVADFLVNRKNDFAELKAKLEEGDRDFAQKLAHSWKGFCHPYGFTILGDIAIIMDEKLKMDQNADLDPLIDNISTYLKLKEEAIANG